MDELTQAVLDYQAGEITFESVRSQVLLETYISLKRFHPRCDDQISEFLLSFADRIRGLVQRFEYRGLEFRRYLMRSLRWQWTSAQSGALYRQCQENLAVDQGWSCCAEVDPTDCPADEFEVHGELPAIHRKRLVLLALKAAPFLDDSHWEAVSRISGEDLAWILACRARLQEAMKTRIDRNRTALNRQAEIYQRCLMAEDSARREPDAERRAGHLEKARLYRLRLTRLRLLAAPAAATPSHREIAEVLGLPKGTVDSALHHLKKHLRAVYSDSDESSPCDK